MMCLTLCCSVFSNFVTSSSLCMRVGETAALVVYPMGRVRVKGSSKRTKVPRILTIKEFNLLLARLTEPFRTMALVALFLGPRVSEVMGLKWSDVDWDGLNISIARSWVEGNVEDTKTEG